MFEVWYVFLLQEFHAKYYHPSNGRFWFYGDDDPTKRLAVLDAYLKYVVFWCFGRGVLPHFAACCVVVGGSRSCSLLT